jgi:endonuclease/exonuclease/phosphatase family metal-dependent hydrolase
MSVEPNMELQVVSWNVDGWHTIRDQQLRLLDDTGADVALLQEVTPTSLRRLRHAGWHGDSALELVDDDHTERRGRRPRFACAVLARRDITVVSSSLIAATPSTVRALLARLRVRDLEVMAMSAALPPGRQWGRAAKVGQAEAIFQAARDAAAPVLVGMDRNGPKHERWNLSATEWWREDPAHLFDGRAAHGCIDVLDRWFASNRAALQHAMRQQPDGPREVSYVERRASPPVNRRYDVIMVDESWDVRHVRYRYEEAIEAGSDHGLVEATLSR